MNKIADLKKMFERIGNAEARAEYKQIKKAEKLYLGAVEKAGYAYVGRKIISYRPDEELDKPEKIQYAFKGKRVASYINNQLSTPTLSYIRNELYKLYDGVESGIADGFAIEMGNDVYIVDSGKDNGKIDVGVRGKRHISDPIARKEFIRRKNGKSIQQGHISDGLSSKFGREYDDDWNSNRGRKRGQELSTDNAKSQNNQSGVLAKNANNGGRGLSFSLKDSVEKDVLARCGSTYRWAETGYIFKDGTRLDLSGRRDGASGGRRTVDHRDIFDVYEDIDGGEAMIEFMSRGNIRVSPENPGINLQVEPTAEQYRLIQDMVERLGWKEEYFSVDFDDSNGDTVESLTYEGKVSARKVVADIKYYFKEGKLPYQSKLSQFRFSLKADINDYTEKQYNDFGWARVNGVLSYRENGNFRAKYGEIKSGKQKQVHRTVNGEIIVETNDMEKGKFGVNNVLVFAKGSYENYKITRVIRINLQNETDIEIVRDYIYERERSRTSTSIIVENLYEQELIREYRDSDFENYQELKRQRRESKGNSGIDRGEQDGSGNLGENQGTVNFSLKDKYFYRLTDGQVKKALANYTKFKVYSKVDAESIINNVLGNYMSFGESYGVISGKTKNEVIEMLWRGLNTAEPGRQTKVALDIAEYILQNAVLENI